MFYCANYSKGWKDLFLLLFRAIVVTPATRIAATSAPTAMPAAAPAETPLEKLSVPAWHSGPKNTSLLSRLHIPPWQFWILHDRIESLRVGLMSSGPHVNSRAYRRYQDCSQFKLLRHPLGPLQDCRRNVRFSRISVSLLQGSEDGQNFSPGWFIGYSLQREHFSSNVRAWKLTLAWTVPMGQPCKICSILKNARWHLSSDWHLLAQSWLSRYRPDSSATAGPELQSSGPTSQAQKGISWASTLPSILVRARSTTIASRKHLNTRVLPWYPARSKKPSAVGCPIWRDMSRPEAPATECI